MATITKDTTGKDKNDRYRVILPKKLAEEFVKEHGKKVNIRKYGKNRLIIEPEEWLNAKDNYRVRY